MDWHRHLIGAEFLDDAPAALVLGDNLFHGHELIPQLRAAADRPEGALCSPIRCAIRSAMAWWSLTSAAPP